MTERILHRRWPWLLAAGLVVLAYLSTLVEVRLGSPDSREIGTAEDVEALAARDDVNLLFIVIDTLRAHRLGSYGYERDTSPTLDALADRGVRFAHHLAQSSWTKCSMASLWTGLNPARAGVTRFDHRIPTEARLPAEILRDAGFHTGGVWRNGWVEGYFGFDQGFDLYLRPAAHPPPATVRRENPTLEASGTDGDAVLSAVEFLRVYGRERWFLYLHLMDVHEYLYDVDSALFGTSYTDVYDNSIRHTDSILNELMVHLSEGGHLEDTLVVIASDHGEAFGERGFEGHARRVYRETTEVPLILSFPFRLEPGVVVESRTSNVDLWPTLLDLLGLPPLEHADGRSRRPEILAAARGEAPPGNGGPGYAHLDQTWGQRDRKQAPTVAIYEDGFRYVLARDEAGREREELFDVRADPQELENVLADNAAVAERLRARARSYLDSEPPWETPTLELDELQLNQLRALGYSLP